MISVEHVLDRLHIDSTSRCGAVQDVRTLIESAPDPIAAAKSIIMNLSDVDFDTNDAIVARMTAQRLVDEAIVLGEKYDCEAALKKAAEKIAEARIKTPWVFATSTGSSVASTTETREGVNVEVKADGKMKKGGKQILAKALYEKHKALSNKEILAIFMKELDMSEAGARTYFYNAKKESTK